ncbi:MAG: crosslink repair DNA glycosylase YcaQ family protein [Nocardioides sp.]
MSERAAHLLTRAEACRVAVHAASLAAEAPVDLLDAARRLTMLPLDRTRAVAPAADLVLFSRLGGAYSLGDLDAAVAAQQVVEVGGALRPVEHATWYRAEMAAWPTPGVWKDWHHQLHDWMEANQAARLDVLERLRQDGPLAVSALPDTCQTPWRSTGWNDGKNVRMLVSQLVQRGEVAVAGRDDRGRTYDLAERVYLDEPVPELTEAQVELDRRRLGAFGVARAGDVYQQGEPVGGGQAGEPAVVEGVRGRWRVDPEALAALSDYPEGTERTALLSPFDVLLHDRRRMADLLGFDYALEMFKPRAKRRWGYYALPILHGHRLVGKVDVTADLEAGELLLHAVHRDEPFSASLEESVEGCLADLARWLGVVVVVSPHR